MDSMYRNQDQRDFARRLRNQRNPSGLVGALDRAAELGGKFRRQAAIGAYLVDLVCFSHKLVIELDGPQHLEPACAEHDARRTAWLRRRAIAS